MPMRLIPKYTLVLSCLIIGSLRAEEVNAGAHGCQSLENARRLARLREAEQHETFRADLARFERAGECRQWSVGDRVVKTDELDGCSCLAPTGSRGVCYWSSGAIGP